MKQTFVMGKGDTLVAVGTFGPSACIVLCPAPDRGVVGMVAPQHEKHVHDHGTAIVFEDRRSIRDFISKLTELDQKLMRMGKV